MSAVFTCYDKTNPFRESPWSWFGVYKRWVYVCCLYSAPMYNRGVLLTMPLPPHGIYYKGMLRIWQDLVTLVVVVYKSDGTDAL